MASTSAGSTTSAAPPVVHEIAALRDVRRALSGRVAVVMTMGALHAGHVSLVKLAKSVADHVIVTIFVNPLQFGEGEDFESYPRTLTEDCAALAGHGVDVVFAPSAAEMYHEATPRVSVSAGEMGTRFEGATRPGHFDGVLTVVSKLLHITEPDVAIFGQKDAQQLAVIRAMVSDLSMPVDIVGAPTIRDEDGLALSSRNRYLSADERQKALALSRALREAAGVASEGAEAVVQAGRRVLADAKGVKLDYLELVDPADFTVAAPDFSGVGVLAVAAWVGSTRLIDNTEVDVVAPTATHL